MNNYDENAENGKTTDLQAQKRAKTEQEIAKIIKETFDIDCDIHSEDLLEDDLGLDSLEYVELVTDLEKHYQISISDRDADRIKTFGQLADTVNLYLAKRDKQKTTKPAGKAEYSAETIEAQVLKIVSEACGNDCKEPISIDSLLSEDLGCSSLDILEIIIRCEDCFNINIHSKEQDKISRVSDLVDIVKRKSTTLPENQ